MAVFDILMLDIAKQIRPGDIGIADKLPRKELPKALIWLIAPWVGMQRDYVAGNVNFPLFFNAERSVEELGLSYRPIAETLNDHARQLLNDGALSLTPGTER